MKIWESIFAQSPVNYVLRRAEPAARSVAVAERNLVPGAPTLPAPTSTNANRYCGLKVRELSCDVKNFASMQLFSTNGV